MIASIPNSYALLARVIASSNSESFNKVFKVTNGTESHIMCGDEAAEMR